jgi:hypothetical protein
MEELMSAGERKQRIIADIIHDFGVQPRLNNDRGAAIYNRHSYMGEMRDAVAAWERKLQALLNQSASS